MILSIEDVELRLLHIGYENVGLKGLMDVFFSRVISRDHNTKSHGVHSIGVAQAFLLDNPDCVGIIKNSSFEPFEIRGCHSVFTRFTAFMAGKTCRFGPNLEYSFDTFKNILPQNLGGNVSGGGGGGHEFKIALRLIAEMY